MDVERRESANGRIALAHEPPFRLGPLLVEPAMRRLAHDEGGEEILEQRVMQVLVALARAGGAILSRDDLVRRCWEGRIVGDDAINRVVSRLRRSAQTIGQGSFRIETITKVGYRLVGGDVAEPNAAKPKPRLRIPPLFLIAAILASIAILGLLALRGHGENDVPTVAVITETQGGEGETLARHLSADLSRLAGARAGDLAIVDSTHAGDADYVVRIGAGRRTDLLEAELTLVDRADGELLWSARFSRPAAELSDLREQIAVKLGDVLLCTLHSADAGEARLDTVTLRLFLSYCDQIHDNANPGGLDLIRRVTERAPGFARAWAYLAMEEAARNEAAQRRGLGSEPSTPALRAAAHEHLRRARAMDPTLGETYLAEIFLITEPDRWAERLAIFDRGIAVAPSGPLYDYRSVELMRVGRWNDAVESARRAVALDPLSPWHQNVLVSTLLYSGDVAGARSALEAAERIWPGSEAMRDMRFRFDLRYGDAAHALAMLDDPANAETTGAAETREASRAFLQARLDPNPAKIEAAIRAAARRTGSPGRPAAAYLQLLAYFGRVDEAYRLLDEPASRASWRYGTEILFRSQMSAIRRDPRFMPLTLRLGLLHYWRTSGRWPDFCADADLPYDCRAEAARLRA